jgi:hypothetical protein
MPKIIKTEQEFEAMMREIDVILQEHQVPIHLREIKALGEAARILDVDALKVDVDALKGGPLTSGPIPGIYEGDSLSAHIFEWLRKRYDKRLRVDFSNGYSVLILRGDAWLFRYPLVYGQFRAVCERNLAIRFPNAVARFDGQTPRIVFNLLHGIEKLSQGLASDLSDDELREVIRVFVLGHDLFTALASHCRSDELAMAARLDFNSSARHCVAGAREYGFSRWGSLQAAEKSLKHYITKKGGQFSYTHNLEKIAARAYQLGLPKIDDALITSIQCDADVRYQKGGHVLDDVVRANHNAIAIGSVVTRTLYPS